MSENQECSVAGLPADLLVESSHWAADGIIVLDLIDREGRPLPRWSPGAHLEIQLPSGLIRQYSLCGETDDHRRYRIAILRSPESRGGSEEVHTTQLVGQSLRVQAVRNHFELSPAPRYLFIAGGIGITPILPMVTHCAKSAIPWQLIYSGRRHDAMAFTSSLSNLTGGKCEYVQTETSPRCDIATLLANVDSGTAVYCCGPRSLLDAVEQATQAMAAPPSLHLERFEGRSEPAAPKDTGDAENAFEVTLARTGVTLGVAPDQSILHAVLQAVPSFLYSCEEGYCGTCEAVVLDGEPDHRDIVLSPDEQQAGKMMICVSRACSDKLVLDL